MLGTLIKILLQQKWKLFINKKGFWTKTKSPTTTKQEANLSHYLTSELNPETLALLPMCYLYVMPATEPAKCNVCSQTISLFQYYAS